MLKIIDKLRKRFQREKGSLVIEATFVYPLIFFVLMFLLYMGNMYYLKARIDSEVSQEAMRYAALYADPNLDTFEDGVPTSAEGTTTVTDHLYRYVNFLDAGDFGKADSDTRNALIDRISDTGFFSGMTPYDIDVVKHEVNNYVIYQTYEVEVSYKLKIPIKFLFTDDITFIDMSAREEAAVTDTSEFIRNVDMAVDYVERSKSGNEFVAKMNEVYGRVNEFINGEKYDPSDAAAGGSPGFAGLTGTAKVEYYTNDIVDGSGKVDKEKLRQVRLAVQKGVFTSDEIKLLSQEMSTLGLTEEYEEEMKKMDFGTYLTNIKGNKPATMQNPHAHHILFKTGNGPEQQKLVEEGQEILRKYGIDPIVGEENLTWAPNAVTGQHSKEALEELVEALKAVDEDDGDYDDIVEVLQQYGKKAASRG